MQLDYWHDAYKRDQNNEIHRKFITEDIAEISIMDNGELRKTEQY